VRIGVDSSKFPGAAEHSPRWLLRRADELGLEGVAFRSVLELSPRLDPGELREIGELASALGLYLEVGATKINPFALPEQPEVRALGDGDTVRGIERLIAAAASIGIHEVWGATANYKFDAPGYLGCDRFRTDVTWDEQLAAILKLMQTLAPILRAYGSHLNLETHEEITTFELVRLVEAAGPDVFGITFDVANVICRAEEPVAAARRVAPYVRATHMRDAGLRIGADGVLHRIVCPCGAGVITLDAVLGELATVAPDLTLSIEGVIRGGVEMPMAVKDPAWIAAHPDLEQAELDELMRRARESRVGAPWVGPREQLPDAVRLAFITDSAQHLRQTLRRKDDTL
jgi:sugar phosphate isomerase/epimerase